MYEAVALLAFVAFAASVAIRYPSLPAQIPRSASAAGTPATWPRWTLWIGVVLVGVIDALTATGRWSVVRAHPNSSWLAVLILTLYAAWTTRQQGDIAVGKRTRPNLWLPWVFIAAYIFTVFLGPRVIG